MALTAKQQRYVDEYLIDLTATQAATRVGYSKETANEQGSRLLATVSVGTAISQRMNVRS
jgi:phage terminase small subunit